MLSLRTNQQTRCLKMDKRGNKGNQEKEKMNDSQSNSSLPQEIQETIQRTKQKVNRNGKEFYINKELQDKLRKVRYKSRNSEVARELYEFRVVDILLGVIKRSNTPRVIVICIGILTNMARVEDICVAMTRNTKLRDLVLHLLGVISDSPIFISVVRFLFTCLSNSDVPNDWKDIYREKEEHIQSHVISIIGNSTNYEDDRLEIAGEVFYIILDNSDEACETWASTNFIRAVLEAIKKIGYRSRPAVESYFNILHLLSTTGKGMEALKECSGGVEEMTIKYLTIVCEENFLCTENYVPCIKDREACLASALLVLHISFSGSQSRAQILVRDENLAHILVKFNHVVCIELKHNKENPLLKQLYNIIKEFIHMYIQTISTMVDDVVMFLLTRLNSCSPWDIAYLTQTLNDSATTNFDHVKALRVMAEKHEQARLIEIIQDYFMGFAEIHEKEYSMFCMYHGTHLM